MSHRIVALSLIVGIFAWAPLALAQMSSTNFMIRWDSVSTGGSDTSASASYQLRDTVGNTGIGNGSSSSYLLRAGYRQGVFDEVITFDVASQNNSSGRAATGLVGTTITTSTSGLAVEDLITLVQDEGSGQVAAIGRIISVGVGTVTVDELKDGGVAPVIDGTNDFVYELNNSSIALGTLTDATLATSIVGFEVSADADNGYVVQVFEDMDLSDGGDVINDVLDGAVTIGSEEYGGRSSDTTLAASTFDTVDTAFTTSFQDVADFSSNAFDRKDFVTVKAAISSGTADGNYGHVLSFIVSGNF